MLVVNKSVRVEAELWQKARAKALGEGKTMQTLIKDLLTAYLNKKGGK
jgi:hypothetical protein